MTGNIKGDFNQFKKTVRKASGIDAIESGASKLSPSHVASKIRGPYRSPSIQTRLGITKFKKNLRQATGINALARWKPSRVAQRLKQKSGWYDKPMKDLRANLSFNRFNPFNRIPKL
jgi:hypothetical protein